MKVHGVVARTLRQLGTDTVFGLMGDANMRFLIDFAEREGGRYISAVDEGAAVSMADGYSRVGNRLGVASVTHGPGVANTVTALTEAVRASSTMIVVTGDTPSRPGHLQRFDLRAVAGLTGAGYHRVLRPEDVADDVAAVIRRVLATRRPVLLDVPVDLHHADVPEPHPAGPARTGHAFAPDPDELDQALGVIAGSRRPVVLAGRGAALAGARDDLVELADLIGAPLATTLLAKDLFRGHPYDLGVAGTLGTELSTGTILAADCVVAFGAELNRYTTAEDSLLRDKAVVRIDIDPERLSRGGPAHTGVLGDAGVTARAMTEQLRDAGLRPGSFRGAELAAALAAHDPRAEFADRGGPATLDLRSAMIRLDELLPAERAVVTDTGRFVYAPWRYLHVPEPTAFAHTLNFASIGLGIATAIGAAAVAPERLTVAVVGDGGGMMGMAELITAVRWKLPIVVVVCNDGAYGMEYHHLEKAGVDPAPSLLHWPDFAPVARAYGAEAVTVRTMDELEAAVKRLDATSGVPFVIEIKADPSVDVGETS
ncbi:thiamine pyrophosphate-binding protein [Microbispora sp. H11081]|uniref:thiamine pyrophosphate-binding protein n=1 Tax=Microbispora sp. H11081 TaxID=2729107 RepID=UPI0014764542|nr:thiamine pyrophosphate-binding protein [Microbispora sp. H11081]